MLSVVLSPVLFLPRGFARVESRDQWFTLTHESWYIFFLSQKKQTYDFSLKFWHLFRIFSLTKKWIKNCYCQIHFECHKFLLSIFLILRWSSISSYVRLCVRLFVYFSFVVTFYFLLNLNVKWKKICNIAIVNKYIKKH